MIQDKSLFGTVTTDETKKIADPDFVKMLGLDSYYSPSDLALAQQRAEQEQKQALSFKRENQNERVVRAAIPIAQPKIQSQKERDIMPNIITQRQREALLDDPKMLEKSQQELEAILSSTFKMNKGAKKETKGLTKSHKIVITLYVAIVLALTAAIAIAAIVMNNLNSEVSALESVQAAKLEALAEQQRELILLENNAVLADKAEELGFDDITNYQPLVLLEINAEQTFTANTNWFDKLCDFLSNLSGG